MSKEQREMTYEELKYAYMKKVRRVHELEKQLEESRIGLYNCNMCYERVEQQNKRYREVIKKAESVLGQDSISANVAKYTAITHLRQALEGEESETD